MAFDYTQKEAKELDEKDPFKDFRDLFLLPKQNNHEPAIYFLGNSVGPPVKKIRSMIEEEITQWGNLGAKRLFEGEKSWYTYIDNLALNMASLVGAKKNEVVLMNSLSANIHLLFYSLYKPTKDRYKILVETPTFSSDLYAIKSQIELHQLDPADCLISVKPRPPQQTILQEDIEEAIEKEGDKIAILFFSGVNFLTGQAFDLKKITQKAQEKGIIVGYDLAHAVGNIPLFLDEWNVDFAVWCTYKYLSSGPGSIGGAYLNEKHFTSPPLPRLAGWWGVDPANRFQFQLSPDFIAPPNIGGWQLSNPPILGSIPLEASLEIYQKFDMKDFRMKSNQMTTYFLSSLKQLSADIFEIITPTDFNQRGCQTSLMIFNQAEEFVKTLKAEGVVCDFRAPNILRVTMNPLYNKFEEIWLFIEIFKKVYKQIN